MRTPVKLEIGNGTLYSLADDATMWVMARNIQTFAWEWRRMVDLPQDDGPQPPEEVLSPAESLTLADSPAGTPV